MPKIPPPPNPRRLHQSQAAPPPSDPKPTPATTPAPEAYKPPPEHPIERKA